MITKIAVPLLILAIALVLFEFADQHRSSPNTSPSNTSQTTTTTYTDPHDVTFLDIVHRHLIWVHATAGTDKDASFIRLGHGVCGSFTEGDSREAIHGALIANGNLSDSDAGWLITAAVTAYCPNYPE